MAHSHSCTHSTFHMSNNVKYVACGPDGTHDTLSMRNNVKDWLRHFACWPSQHKSSHLCGPCEWIQSLKARAIHVCITVYVKRQWPQGQHDLDSFSLLIWATMSLGDEHEGGQCGFGHEHLHWLVGEPCCESAL